MAPSPCSLQDVNAVPDWDVVHESIVVSNFVPTEEVGGVGIIPGVVVRIDVAGRLGAGMQKDNPADVFTDADGGRRSASGREGNRRLALAAAEIKNQPPRSDPAALHAR